MALEKKHSTNMAIYDILESKLGNRDKNQLTCAVYLDLSKAFDTVDTGLLLKKLEHYGIRGISLKLFKSYLESRNFKLESPKDLSIIGSHVTISHSESWRICKSLINPQKGKKIIVDFRPNNYLRIAITPLYTSFDEILKLVVRLVEILDTGEFKLHDNSREIVT